MVLIILLVIIVVFVIILTISLSNEKERGKYLDLKLSEKKDFTTSFIVKNYENKYMLCVDDSRRKILYYIVKDRIEHLFDFDNVISVEVIEDSNVTFSKSSMRTIGGGIIGGIIGGGAGAIVGGLSGKNKGKKKVKEIKVKILLRNYSTPALYIECLSNEQIEWDSDSIVYEQTINEARRISDKLSVVIDLIDREAKTRQMELMENQTSKVSIAEELEKLHSLREKGIISEEEYIKLKEKLL